MKPRILIKDNKAIIETDEYIGTISSGNILLKFLSNLDISYLKKACARQPNNNKLVKKAQWGGMGGWSANVPGSGGYSAWGYERLIGDVNFTNYMTRQPEEASLDLVRPLEENSIAGQNRSIEHLLQDNGFNNHKRNDIDDNLFHYNLSQEERIKLKKEMLRKKIADFRMKQYINEKNKQQPGVWNRYKKKEQTMEEKLERKRKYNIDTSYNISQASTRDKLHKESQMVIKHDMNSLPFDPEYDYGGVLELRRRIDVPTRKYRNYNPSQYNIETSLRQKEYPQIFNEYMANGSDMGYVRKMRSPYADASQRVYDLPPGMKDPVPEDRNNIGGEIHKMFAGHPYYSIHVGPLAADMQFYRDTDNIPYAEHNPPQPENAFNTYLDRYEIIKDEIARTLRESKESYRKQRENKEKISPNRSIEQSLTTKHKNKLRTIENDFVYNTLRKKDQYPWAGPELFSYVGLGRLRWAGEVP